ncbi:MAG: nucleotidyltransferase domain-containing protein [Acidobacteriota bacterium]
MNTALEIKAICERIAREFHPERIILFGSHAVGNPHADSDVDLLVVMPFEGRHTEQAIKILNKLNVLAPIDLLIRTPEQVQERIQIGDAFMRDIIERGKVLYEANHR